MLKKLIITTVRFSAQRPWPVLAAGLALAVASAFFVAAQFEINTDISKLISKDLPWRQREIEFFKAFPEHGDGYCRGYRRSDAGIGAKRLR